MSDAQASVPFFGEDFNLAEEVDDFTLLEFAEVADDSLEDNPLGAMAAMMRLLRSAIDEDDWPRFRRSCRKNKAKIDDLLPVIQTVFYRETNRPTMRPADSSGGPQETAPSSTADSSSRAIAQLTDQRRPDLAMFVVAAEQERASA